VAASSCGLLETDQRTANKHARINRFFLIRILFGYTVLSARKSRFMSVLMQLEGGAVSPL
jgi:hypothetical protein